ncbi:MAG: phosphate ABC transporter permease subunit PstC, partial [Olsenella sp.]|nr:phosphate ABC transporter permease subunit PstC [Olsenella sp.]
MSKRMLPKRRLENVGLTLTGACVALVALIVVTLIVMVAQQGLSAFLVDGLDFGQFVTGTSWVPSDGKFGALPLIVTSFGVMLLSTLLTLPIALGSAIFVVEVRPGFGRKVFQPLVELLVGIPSVVYGLIGLTVVNAAMRAIFGEAAGTGAGILSGAIVLAVMILPTVTTLSIDALAAVPNQYREGSYALGCTRWQTVWHVVLKSALPSLMTAVILGMTRAFGETLAVQMVIGGVEKIMPAGLLSPAATLTTALTSGFANATTGSVQYHA